MTVSKRRMRLRNRLRKYFWNKKLAESTAYILLLVMVVRLCLGHLDLAVAIAALGLSGAWLALTFLELRVLLRTYYDILSRLIIWSSLVIGIVLSVVAVVASQDPAVVTGASIELFGWAYVYLRYRKNRNTYIDRKHGPLPAGTWKNPPVDALKPGDIVLTSGRISRKARENVGHGEVLYLHPSGELWCWSSYMENGAIRQRAVDVLSKCLADGEHYIILRLIEPLTAEQIALAPKLVEKMYADNVAWRDAETIRRRAFVDGLPLSQARKEKLFERIKPTGYDWFGLFSGIEHEDRWVCIVAAIRLLRLLGVTVAKFGTGILGLGTGLLDPLVPVRLLGDPAFRLLSEEDQKEFEQTRSQ